MSDQPDPGVPEPGPSDDPPAAAASTEPAVKRRRAELWRFLEIFALCGFVVVQPVLDVIGGSPDFFIFHGVSPFEIAALVALFVLVPPVLLWAAGALIGLAGRPARAAAHLVTVAGLFTLFMIEIGKHFTPIRGLLLVTLAAVATAVVVIGYLRLAPTRQLLRFAAVGPLVFVLAFTFASPASAVMLIADRPSTGGEAPTIGPQPPIVMIVLDELALTSLLDAEGGIDAERFPQIARLAGDATWYRNATTSAGWTPYALPSMLTGRWPAEHAAPHYAVYPDNLFTLLGDHYRVSASESISALCPPWHCGDRTDRSRGGFPVALAESTALLGELVWPADPTRDPQDDFAEPTVLERLGAAAAARADRPEFLFNQALAASQPVRFHDFMTELRAAADPAQQPLDPEAGQPPLHFLHLLLPHTPWTYFPDGMQYTAPRLPVDGQWWGRLAFQRYQAQLRYADLLIGEVLDELETSGRYDETLVVLTADHGVSLTPDGAGSRELAPDHPGIIELAWVPLFIKAPGQAEGVVDDRNWQHVDLLPTLAELAGVAVPWHVDGISWQREQRTGPDKTFYPTLDEAGVIDGPAGFAKLLADPYGFPPVPAAPLPELVGTAVSSHVVIETGTEAQLPDLAAYAAVDPRGGTVPALVHGWLSEQVPEGTPLAIAVNGRIGAVVPVVADPEGMRFAGLVEEHRLFLPGDNRVELFLVPDGETLHRLSLTS